jgi:hypothetical protein
MLAVFERAYPTAYFTRNVRETVVSKVPRAVPYKSLMRVIPEVMHRKYVRDPSRPYVYLTDELWSELEKACARLNESDREWFVSVLLPAVRVVVPARVSPLGTVFMEPLPTMPTLGQIAVRVRAVRSNRALLRDLGVYETLETRGARCRFGRSTSAGCVESTCAEDEQWLLWHADAIQNHDSVHAPPHVLRPCDPVECAVSTAPTLTRNVHDEEVRMGFALWKQQQRYHQGCPPHQTSVSAHGDA